jgi:hypothetical protein
LDFLAWLRRLFGIGGQTDPPPKSPPNPCEAPACVSTKQRLENARNAFTSVCSGIRSVSYVVRLLSQVIVVPLWMLALLLVVAALVGGIVAVIIWGLVGVYLFAWFLYLVLQRVLAVLIGTLNQRALEFSQAVPDVIANCPADCRGDLSLPVCAF